jgi:hypothetical protein
VQALHQRDFKGHPEASCLRDVGEVVNNGIVSLQEATTGATQKMVAKVIGDTTTPRTCGEGTGIEHG